MATTQHREVRERRRPTVGPVAYVMALAELDSTAGKAATAVAVMQGAAQRGWNRARPRADFYGPPIRVVPHDDAARVAGHAAGRFRGNVRSAFEDRLAGRVGIRQYGSIDVDDDLVTLTWRAGVEVVVERGLCDQGKRVCLLLRRRGRFPGDVLRAADCARA